MYNVKFRYKQSQEDSTLRDKTKIKRNKVALQALKDVSKNRIRKFV